MRFNIWGTQEQAVANMAKKPGAIITRHKTLPVVAIRFQSINSERGTFAVWIGKAGKPSFYLTFRTMALTEENLAHYWKRAVESLHGREERKKEKAERMASLRAADYFTVGDVIYNSWGYDQTNIDWYEVTEVKAKSIVIREIDENRSYSGHAMTGETQPKRGVFIGESMLKPLRPHGNITFDHGGASKWNGKPQHYSTYA